MIFKVELAARDRCARKIYEESCKASYRMDGYRHPPGGYPSWEGLSDEFQASYLIIAEKAIEAFRGDGSIA